MTGDERMLPNKARDVKAPDDAESLKVQKGLPPSFYRLAFCLLVHGTPLVLVSLSRSRRRFRLLHFVGFQQPFEPPTSTS